MEESLLQDVFLKKSQRKRLFSINYKQYLFVLTKTSLTYYNYKHGKQGKQKGVIELEAIRCVETVSLNNPTPVDRQYPIQILYNAETLYIYADGEQSRTRWLAELKHAIKNNQHLALKYHSAFWAGDKWLCCLERSQAAPACTNVTDRGVLREDSNRRRSLPLPPVPSEESEHTSLPKPVTPSSKMAEALYQYDAKEQTDISLEKGEKYYIINDSDQHWWKLKDMKGREGYAPSSYLTGTNKEAEQCSKTSNTQFTNPPKQSDKLEDYVWYAGPLARAKAEQLLKQMGKEGGYLLRNSSQGGGYVVSVFTKALESKGGATRHYHIHQTAEGKYYLAENHLFDTIPEVIKYHQHNSAGLITRLRQAASTETNKVPGSVDVEWELNRGEIILVKELGSGQFGVVQLGKWKHKYDVAIKMIKEGSMSTDEFLEEAETMMKLKHPKLVQLHGVCTIQYPILIVTEYMSNGCLLSYLKDHGKELNQFQLLEMCYDVTEAMAYLEDLQFIHRDLAARNCLVDNTLIVKVCDFGMARYVLDDQYISSTGTKFPVKWSSPEIFFYSKFSSKSDVWAFGVLMWEVFTLGKMPYERFNNGDLIWKILSGYRLYKPRLASEEIFHIMSSCWHEQPEERPTFKQLLFNIQPLREDDRQ
ncbi:cytoplasmic tyrosine-protein kinase BMX-like [Carcharodon carcharias]|uniref:cytoplasmic tyrosine-protein kinase BMX-like n=1 Tax=Carcharodon carcharias TaxID=13397 RepID=UPI001B7DF7AF|nr:cytoplasmic tyrosine-protein kinase BMX-like [Carcharodon carcharias]